MKPCRNVEQKNIISAKKYLINNIKPHYQVQKTWIKNSSPELAPDNVETIIRVSLRDLFQMAHWQIAKIHLKFQLYLRFTTA